MKRQIGSGGTGLPAFLVLGIFSLLAQEAISRGGLLEALAWVMGSPQLALANLALIYSVMMLLSALIGRMAPGALLALMALVLFALVNHGKPIRLHQPLFPWDFWCYKHVLALFPALSKPEISTSSLAPVPAAVLVFLWMLLRRGSPPHDEEADLGAPHGICHSLLHCPLPNASLGHSIPSCNGKRGLGSEMEL